MTRARAQGRAGATRRQAGITVLELMITLAVVAILMVLGYNGVRFVSKSELREDTTEVAAVLRAAYNMATMSRQHHRVVFDLDEQTYRIERCEGNISLRMQARGDALRQASPGELEAYLQQARDSLSPAMAGAMSPEEATRMALALSGSRVGLDECGPPELMTGDARGRGHERSLRTERGLRIRHMQVQHLEGEQSAGIVHVNFFPGGRAEKAVLAIGDDDGNQYTLLLHGLTGRIEFLDGRVDADEHMMRRADGARADDR